MFFLSFSPGVGVYLFKASRYFFTRSCEILAHLVMLLPFA